MLKNYPLTINGVEIPFAKSDSASYDPIEQVNQSETGKDILQITRAEKVAKSFTTGLTSEWEPIFRNFQKSTEPLVVQIYDIETHDYKTYQMRLRKLKVSKRKYSEDLEFTDGIYDFSFDLIQF